MAIKHHTILPQGTIGAIDQPQWAEGHDVDAGGITFNDGTVQTTAGGPVGTARATSALSAGANNNLNPGGAWPAGFGRLILTSPGGASNVTGLRAGSDGQWMLIFNADPTNMITLNSLNAGSAAANQFQYFTDLVLSAGVGVVAVYDATLAKWLLT